MKNKNWYCADFETTSKQQYKIEGKTRVYLWCLIEGNTNKTYYGVDIESFFITLEMLKQDTITIYFHNLSFDGEFILWYLLESGYTLNDNFTLNKNEFNTIIDDTGSIYQITCNVNGKTIKFTCSYKLFPRSIKDIGEMVGIKKLNETHNYEEIKNFNSLDEVNDEEISYITNDVKIAVELIKYLRTKGINSITMSSSAYKNWQKDKKQYFLSKNDMIKDDNDYINEIVRLSYKGGITKVNKDYIDQEFNNVISFDVNSLYPSVMYDNIMPIGKGKIYKSIEECKHIRPVYLVHLVVSYANIKKGFHPFIGIQSGYKYNKSYDYKEELDTMDLYLWKYEYELFEMCYEGIWSITEVIGWKALPNIFKDYIDRWYAIKENPSCPSERQLAKLMLNSLYGKFGMNDNRISKYPVGYNGNKIIYRYDTKNTTYYYKVVASWITSLARTKLATQMQLCEDKFLYCDTDSIYLIGDKIPNTFKECVDSKKMGFWKFEGHYTRFKALKPKCYIKQLDNGEIVRTIAGCPKNASELINFDNFKIGLKLKNVKNVKVKVKGGIIIDTTDFEIHREE